MLKKTILERNHQLSASRFLHFVCLGGFAHLPPFDIATLIGGPTFRLLRIWGVNGARPQFFHSGWLETHIDSIGNKYRCIQEWLNMEVDTRIGEASTILRELCRSGVIKQELNARASHHSDRYSFGHNSPAAAARHVFKPSTYSACLLVPTEKKICRSGDIPGRRDKWGRFSVFMAYFTRP